jgi:hypothetical protein
LHIFKNLKVFKEFQSRRGHRDNIIPFFHVTDGETETQRGKGTSRSHKTSEWQSQDTKHSVLLSSLSDAEGISTPTLGERFTDHCKSSILVVLFINHQVSPIISEGPPKDYMV